MQKELGRITTVRFGHVGYQNQMIGISFCFEGIGWGINTDIAGGWKGKRSQHAKWSESDREKSLVEMCMRISQLLEDAKVLHVQDLIGIPIECELEAGKLVSWRILKEVL